jgi:hypothetical protein
MARLVRRFKFAAPRPSAGARAGAIAAVLAGATALAPACGAPAPLAPLEVHLGDVAAGAAAEGRAELEVPLGRAGARDVTIFLDGAARIVEVAVDAPASLTATLDGAPAAGAGTLDGRGAWFRPAPVDADPGVLTLALDGAPGDEARVTVWARGAPVPPVRRERSLVWTDPEVVDDPSLVGLGRVMAAAAEDGHGGRLLDAWFRRFATTAHSERAAPAQLMDELAASLGADPSAWDLDALPFIVTAVHDRVDLAARAADGSCGQLRVSFASVHPVYAPLHLIFLFAQPAAEDDVAPDGTVHCLGTARRWARMSALDGADFAAAARAWLDAALVHDRFLLAETVELTVSPWEWRQWVPVPNPDPATAALLPTVLDNPPLFQTVDTESLNTSGPLRDDFLAFVAGNAAALDARTLEIPARFRAPSARVPPATPRTSLDLGGLDPAVAAAYPALRERIEIIGCPTCHTTDADFVQTSVARVFSPFYDAELDARAARLDLMAAGAPVPVPPYGPLQTGF